MGSGNAIFYEGSSPYSSFNGHVCKQIIGGLHVDAQTTNNIPGSPWYTPNWPIGAAFFSWCETMFALPFLSQITCGHVRSFGHDSRAMSLSEGLMLHELMHYRQLLIGAPNFNTMVCNVGGIGDFQATTVQPVPQDGYGPLNCHLLIALGDGAARNNADSFRWYALATY